MSDPGLARSGLARWVELPAAALLLIALAPLLLLLAIAVRLSSPGPAFFRQKRMGQGGKPFELIKLRTMRHLASGAPITAQGDSRITPLGRLLRGSKLDELPELWNLVRGELSFVGPRPEVPALVDLDDLRWQKILEARPGLTDPVTLRLRNEEALLAGVAGDREHYYRHILQPFKLAGYIDYLKTRSALGDLRLIWQTILAVIDPARVPPPTREEIEAGYRPQERT